ncbi:MAG: DUF368 domain-containing protein, partial [Halanaerobacter sp.]
ERVLTAISSVLEPMLALEFSALPLSELKVLIAFGLGISGGLMLFSWILSYLLDNLRSLLMAVLTGLILGSMRSVIPNQLGGREIVAFVVGVLIIYLLDRQ